MAMPYIGITGFMRQEEVAEVLSCLPNDSTARKVMIGVLVSSKTLEGRKNKWPNRYPLVEKIGKIFTGHPGAFNVIHYHRKESGALLDQLEKLIELGGGNLDGFQLNIAWPDPKSLERFRMLYSGMYKRFSIILQINNKAFEGISSPEKLAAKVKNEYLGLVDYVLLDLSGGYGKLLDPNTLEPFVEKIQKEIPGMGIVLAGGLSPETFNLVEPLIKKYPFLSTDAEGRLRKPKPDDNLDVEKAKEYLRKAFSLFK